MMMMMMMMMMISVESAFTLLKSYACLNRYTRRLAHTLGYNHYFVELTVFDDSRAKGGIIVMYIITHTKLHKEVL